MASRRTLRIDPRPADFGSPVPSRDARITSIGRFPADRRAELGTPSALPLVWPGSEVRLRFSGPALALRLRCSGEVHLDVEVDGTRYLLSPLCDREHDYALGALPPGMHVLRLVKRTEAAIGIVELIAVHPARDGEIESPPPLPTLRLEFIGDSMTVGACAYDDGNEQWDRHETHDHGASFASLVAQRLQAQHQAIAISGLGVSKSLVGVRAHQIFDRERPDPQSPAAAATPAPDAVVVLLGHNDVLAARRAGEAFPAQFTADYVQLIRAIRRRYPATWIICATGGMFHSVRSSALRRAWDAAVHALQQTDRGILAHRFHSWSYLHPRTHTHARLADELAGLLTRALRWPPP